MKITAYKISEHVPPLVPARVKREWMDNTVNRFAYRCLPLTIANSYGWEIRSTSEFIAEYIGGSSPDNIKIKQISGNSFPQSYFGEGILTWHPGYIFKTEYPYGLYVQGPVNESYSNFIPLAGVVETHWLPFTFTMNWKFTAPGIIHMKQGAPICNIFPVDLTIFDNIEAEIVPLQNNKELYDDHMAWSDSRTQFLKNPRKPEDWEKNYFKGVHPHKKNEKMETHITKLNVKEFQIKND